MKRWWAMGFQAGFLILTFEADPLKAGHDGQ
jgi:hypothetical protein